MLGGPRGVDADRAARALAAFAHLAGAGALDTLLVRSAGDAAGAAVLVIDEQVPLTAVRDLAVAVASPLRAVENAGPELAARALEAEAQTAVRAAASAVGDIRIRIDAAVAAEEEALRTFTAPLHTDAPILTKTIAAPAMRGVRFGIDAALAAEFLPERASALAASVQAADALRTGDAAAPAVLGIVQHRDADPVTELAGRFTSLLDLALTGDQPEGEDDEELRSQGLLPDWGDLHCYRYFFGSCESGPGSTVPSPLDGSRPQSSEERSASRTQRESCVFCFGRSWMWPLPT